MIKIKYIYSILFAFLLIGVTSVFSQISPGDLVQAHAYLEGMSNCTECHTLGEKVSNDKCLACHKELKSRIEAKKGYHASTEVNGKECTTCHSDHHGRNFQIIHFERESFNHSLTGYDLKEAHKKLKCEDCHKKEFIADQELKEKKKTFLGLNTECLNCHKDYHQTTLSTNCIQCHDFGAFKPASGFDHSRTNYPLLGKHTDVSCIKCHKKEQRNGNDFQVFKGIGYENCTNCHEDVHQNKFGQNCRSCHTESSFHEIKGMSNFDHTKTDFPLEGRHKFIDCKACHKGKYTDPINHSKCISCHKDYHKGQFVKEGKSPDCSECHTLNGFSGSKYTIEKHNKGEFALKGAHLATPCFACHKKEEKWNFRDIGRNCSDCHQNIHQSFISAKYLPNDDCRFCHTEERWGEQDIFDHSTTNFNLEGAHKKQSCRSCHFHESEEGKSFVQKFTGLGTNCIVCHNDIHYKQFDEEGITDCERCHKFENWKAEKFDHNQTRFKLEGKHAGLACKACHKIQNTEQYSYILYKLNDIRCETCH
ncbi:MAG: cytochrome C [Bacteroidales bacterium]|nr:cytochrome C [Bacteroidales bacterium]